MERLYMPPSRAGRWFHCSGSPHLEGTGQTYDHNAAQGGVDLHKAMEQWLQSATLWGVEAPMPDLPDATPEDRDALLTCFNSVAEELRAHPPVEWQRLHVEKRMNMGYLDGQQGAIDLMWFNGPRKTIYVWDWKFGRSREDAFENPQLIAELYGITRNFNGLEDQQWSFEAIIVQPNCFQKPKPVDHWSGTLSDLRGYFNQIDAQVEDAHSNRARLTTGDHCRKCAGLANCAAAHETASRFMYYAQQIDVVNLPPEKQAEQIEHLKAGEKFLKSLGDTLDKTVQGLMDAGQQVPGWTMETTKGRRGWKKASEVLPALDLYGLGDCVQRKPLGIGEVTRTAKQRGIDERHINELTQASSNTKLIRVRDTVAGKAFGGGNG